MMIADEVRSIECLAKKYDVAVIVDQLYARQFFGGRCQSQKNRSW